jgi:hypothetical protein
MLMRTPARWVRPKRQLPPGFIVPCQPTLASKVPAGDGWIHELKHDGFRVLAFKDGDTVRLWSRNGQDWSGEPSEGGGVEEGSGGGERRLRVLPKSPVSADGFVTRIVDGGGLGGCSRSPTHATSFHPTSSDTASGSISGSR